MNKIGNFRGYPVYKVDSHDEWSGMITKDKNEIYVVDDDVYFHDIIVGYLRFGQLHNFDERTFMGLERRYKEKKKVIVEQQPAEVKPQSVSKVDEGTGEPAAAVDEFMNSWEINIDKEIAELKLRELEYEDCKTH